MACELIEAVDCLNRTPQKPRAPVAIGAINTIMLTVVSLLSTREPSNCRSVGAVQCRAAWGVLFVRFIWTRFRCQFASHKSCRIACPFSSQNRTVDSDVHVCMCSIRRILHSPFSALKYLSDQGIPSASAAVGRILNLCSKQLGG